MQFKNFVRNLCEDDQAFLGRAGGRHTLRAEAAHSNDEIAAMLHLSLRIVEKHVSSALRKLDLRSRVQLRLLLARP
jgi:hypothetical protein